MFASIATILRYPESFQRRLIEVDIVELSEDSLLREIKTKQALCWCYLLPDSYKQDLLQNQYLEEYDPTNVSKDSQGPRYGAEECDVTTDDVVIR